MISEISSGDGTLLLDEAWLGISMSSEHKLKSWPSYPKPSTAMWNTWRKWIPKAFLTRGQRLRYPLGPWLSWDANWPWYTSSGSLFSFRQGKWLEYWPVLQRRRLPTFMGEGQPCNKPSSVMQATIYRKGDKLICSGSGRILSTPSPTYNNFREFLQVTSGLGWCTQHFYVAPNCTEIVAGIKAGLRGTIMAVSDGSFKGSFGTAAWTIGITDHDHYVSGRVVCPGDANTHSSYQSELTGLYVILAITNHLCNYYNINEGSIEIGCDGLSALQSAFDHGLYLSSDIPDYDLIGAIYHMRKSSKISWSYRHVKGQQDDVTSDLDVWAQQNVRMDAAAKQHIAIAKAAPHHFDIPGEPWQLWVEDRKITSKIQESIYSAVHRPESEAYWEKKEEQKDGIALVDWKNIGYAMKKAPRTR
jgi:hypothetical protein